MSREAYNIAIIGDSGKGKTYSFRNMDPETTGIINLEGKPLPFKNKFKYYSKPSDWNNAYQKLIEYAKNDEIKCVVFESFSAYIDSLLSTAREIKKGYDIFQFYNGKIGELLYALKRYPKDIFVTAHTESLQSGGDVEKERMLVKGNEWKGAVEKDFTIVLYSDVDIKDNKERDYHFVLNSDGRTSAKTPPILFEGEDRIPNDANEVIKELDEKLNE